MNMFIMQKYEFWVYVESMDQMSQVGPSNPGTTQHVVVLIHNSAQTTSLSLLRLSGVSCSTSPSFCTAVRTTFFLKKVLRGKL